MNYATVQRYILFYMLIRIYPRLIFCELSFKQFSKHHNRILKHLGTDIQLAERLKLPGVASAQSRVFDILPIQIQQAPTTLNLLPITADPDHDYEDFINPQRIILDERDIEQFL